MRQRGVNKMPGSLSTGRQQGNRRTSEDLEGDKPPSAPDQDIESWIS